MSLAPLREAAAAYALDSINSEDLRRIADEALTRGVYSYSLAELATDDPTIYSAVRPRFEAALRELMIPLPQPNEAAACLLWHYLSRVYEGTFTPHEAATALRRLSVEILNNPIVRRQLSAAAKGRLYDLEGLFWGYDEVMTLAEPGEQIDSASAAVMTSELDRRMQETAAEVMHDRFRGRIDSSWMYWNDGAVRKVAQAIQNERRFADLPLLGDALEEAGCADVELLEHCREHPPHVNDCWALHLLLAAG